MAADTRRFALALAAVTLLGGALRAHGIADQPPLTDEVYIAFTAEGYVASGQPLPTMPHHPNLRNLLVAASMRVFGPGALGLRFFSLVLGALSVPLLALVVRRISGQSVAGALAGVLLAVDPLHVAFSRQAIQETHVVFFALLGVWFVLVHLDRIGRGGAPTFADDALLPVAGVAFGLALASKFQAVFPLAVVAALAARRSLRARDGGRVALLVASLAILPLTILALTDAPWFGRGYDLGDWVFMRRAVFARMSSSYLPTEMELNPDQKAWEWFVKPFLGYASFSLTGGRPFVAIGMGNPLVWMAVLPSAVFAAADPARRRRTAVLQLLFWASYVPFVLTRRPIFFLTALAPAPFAFGLVAVAVDDLLSSGRRKVLLGYGTAVLAASLLLMPLARGTALEYGYTAPLVRRFAPETPRAPEPP